MKYEFKDDVVYIYIPRPDYGKHISERQIVRTREIFKACYNSKEISMAYYNRWIKNEGGADGE